jgi:hypothetical protein
MNHRNVSRSASLLALVAALAFAFLPTLALAQEKTMTGEVLDLACYIGQGAKGKDHASCARACAKGGQPMGLLTDDGKVYTLVGNHDNMKPYESARDLAGAHVEIKGKVHTQGGLEAIEVLSIAAK